MRNLTQTIESLIFSSGKSIDKKEITKGLGIKKSELDKALEELKEKYSGSSGIHLLDFNDKVQFSSNPNYGDLIADILVKIRERELSKVLLEVLAIVAYKQPVTRLEIEELRGLNSEYALQMLQKVNLIEVVGRKDAIGRPSLYATTDEFLIKFGLNSLDALPSYEEVLEHLKVYDENSEVSLFRQVDVEGIIGVDENMEEEIPDFLKGEHIEEIVAEDDEN